MKKLHLACSNDDLRPHLCHIKFTHTEAIACDGSILVIAKIKDVLPGIVSEGEEIFIHAKDWKKAKAFDAVKFSRFENTITCYDRKKRETTIQFVLESSFERKYPDVHSVIPESFDGELNQIAFNPTYFQRVVESVNCQYGKLSFSAVNKAIRIEPFDKYMQYDFADVMAIMMPTYFA